MDDAGLVELELVVTGSDGGEVELYVSFFQHAPPYRPVKFVVMDAGHDVVVNTGLFVCVVFCGCVAWWCVFFWGGGTERIVLLDPFGFYFKLIFTFAPLAPTVVGGAGEETAFHNLVVEDIGIYTLIVETARDASPSPLTVSVYSHANVALSF